MSNESPNIAAVDLGSNSFHLVVADVGGPQPRIVDRLRDQVQLAAGLDAGGRIDAAVERRALRSLERFGERLRDAGAHVVRAVGTNTLRIAGDRDGFRGRAERALGHPIEVISGHEEARLIFLGVSHTLGDSTSRRFVVDIGGGSTECILGRGFEMEHADSLNMGCVSFSRRFFGKGKITAKAMRRAILAARLELEGLESRYRDPARDAVIGASGTVKTVAAVCRQAGWADSAVTPDALARLCDELAARGSADALELEGLKPERRGVFAGGVAILAALFESFGISELRAAQGALREGVIYDLLGRIRHEDVRERTIETFQERYRVDRDQAARVEATALRLYEAAREPWGLEDPALATVLSWAARLHEIGLAISYRHHQRHAAYLVANADMPGFSRDDQNVLAAIVGAHRRKFQRDPFAALPRRRRRGAVRLAILLRVAVVLNRARTDSPPIEFTASANRRSLRLRFERAILAAHPLTRLDLDETRRAVQRFDLRLLVET